MGAAETAAPCRVLRRSCCRLFLALLLCFQVLRTSQAFEVRTSPHHTADHHCSSAKLAQARSSSSDEQAEESQHRGSLEVAIN